MSRVARTALTAVVLALAGISALAQARVIYSATADAHSDIAQAISTAVKAHKRIILDFGGNCAATARCWTSTSTSRLPLADLKYRTSAV